MAVTERAGRQLGVWLRNEERAQLELLAERRGEGVSTTLRRMVERELANAAVGHDPIENLASVETQVAARLLTLFTHEIAQLAERDRENAANLADDAAEALQAYAQMLRS